MGELLRWVEATSQLVCQVIIPELRFPFSRCKQISFFFFYFEQLAKRFVA